ncbi:MAG: class I mannose-6-phosphate isomerase [Bacteroidales bacterium]|nr:class I mannose-6-phosphate isomerase [Bacteroidales bacterium]
MYPLRFRPILREMVWGGGKIAPFKGIYTTRNRIGESWEVSAVKDHVSVVENGPLSGRSLTDIINEYGAALVGGKVFEKFGNEFPLLIKFIDARDNLSVQVHPDDRMASRIKPGLKGKTEMWYVIGADKGARLLSGLVQEISPDEYEEKVRDNTIMDVLASYKVHPGDVFFLPAGRIHAIGAGTFVAEIQQTSDITYRIYDYGRLGLDGKPRELHIEQAKEAIDYTVYPDYRTEYSKVRNAETPLVACDYFTTTLFDTDKPVSKNLSALDSFVVVICVAGKGMLVDNESDGSVHKIELHQGETLLVPATSSTIEFHPDGAMTCLTSFVR